MHVSSIRKFSNFTQRIISIFFIGVIFLVSIFLSKLLFSILMLLVSLGMLHEWYIMVKGKVSYVVFGVLITILPVICLILVSNNSDNYSLILSYFTIIWSMDIFAFIGGKTIKGPKLAPTISPNKTWSGLVCGMLAASVFTSLLKFLPGYNLPDNLFICAKYLALNSMIMALIAQVSDLFISYFKRKFGIKDSGSIIPGHGGFLDRFDSIILTAPLLYLGMIYENF